MLAEWYGNSRGRKLLTYISRLILGYWRVKNGILVWPNNPLSVVDDWGHGGRIRKYLVVPRGSLGILSQILSNLKWGKSLWLNLVALCKHVNRYLIGWLINMSCLPLKMIWVSVEQTVVKIPTSWVMYSLWSRSHMCSRFPTNLLLNPKDWRCPSFKCKLFSLYLSLDRVDRG